VVGEVHDGFGKPLGDVEISMQTTAYKATTGSNGRYAVPFAPGKFTMSFQRLGYSTYSVTQEISVETTVPLATVTLYKRPPEQGVWFFGSSDYVQIRQGRLVTARGKPRDSGWLLQTNYQLGNDFTRLSQQKVYRFLDSSPAPLALFKVSAEGVLAARLERWFESQIRGTRIKDETKRVEDGMTVREASLGQGRYAYVKVDPEGRISDPVFPFEVQ
jgi:hypothetical protein